MAALRYALLTLGVFAAAVAGFLLSCWLSEPNPDDVVWIMPLVCTGVGTVTGILWARHDDAARLRAALDVRP